MFTIGARVLRNYKNEIWEGEVVGQLLIEGHVNVVCKAYNKEFKMFVTDPKNLRIKDENQVNR